MVWTLGELTFARQYRLSKLTKVDLSALSRHLMSIADLTSATHLCRGYYAQHKAQLLGTAAPKGGGNTASAEPPDDSAAS